MRVLAPLLALLCGVALVMGGHGLAMLAVSLRLDAAGHGALVVGLATTAYFAGLLGGALRVGDVIHRVGHARAFTAFAGGLAALTLVQGLVPVLGVWLVARALVGVCIAGLFLVIESWLQGRADPTTRGLVLGAYMAVYYLALGGGQLLLARLDLDGLVPFAVAALLVALGTVPVALTRTEAPEPAAERFMTPGQLVAAAPLGVAAAVVAGLVLGGFYGLGPVYAQEAGGSSEAASEFMGLAVMGGLLLQWPVGWLSDRFDRRLVLVALSWALVPVSLAVPALAGGGLWLPAGLAFGGTAATLYPLAVAHAADRVPHERWLGANATLVLVSGLGSAVGPTVLSLAMTAVGAWGLFLANALVAGGLGAFGLRQLAQRDSVLEQGEFVAAPRTLTLVTPLDPRIDEDQA
ncbi:MAG: MFS transporter [Deltaproteobacteria bacterium]|nr:MAG: MFS transporter [Deltaproteobacteria bacterium]